MSVEQTRGALRTIKILPSAPEQFLLSIVQFLRCNGTKYTRIYLNSPYDPAHLLYPLLIPSSLLIATRRLLTAAETASTCNFMKAFTVHATNSARATAPVATGCIHYIQMCALPSTCPANTPSLKMHIARSRCERPANRCLPFISHLFGDPNPQTKIPFDFSYPREIEIAESAFPYPLLTFHISFLLSFFFSLFFYFLFNSRVCWM